MAQSHPYHELANIFPMLAGDDYTAFREDIRVNKLRVPIMLFEGSILDGRNRDYACLDLGIAPKFETFTGSYLEAVAYVESLNIRRRHLKGNQRAMVAALAAERSGASKRDVGRMLNVAPAQIDNATAIRRKAVPEITKQVEAGTVYLTNAAKVARLPRVEQRRLAAMGPGAVNAAGKAPSLLSRLGKALDPFAVSDQDFWRKKS